VSATFAAARSLVTGVDSLRVTKPKADDATNRMSVSAVTAQLRRYRQQLDRLDSAVAGAMARWSVPVLRGALGVVFIWFGALKVVGRSPAQELVEATVYVVPPELFVPVLGSWEVAIGLCLLYRPLLRLGILLLFAQLPGTFLPLVVLPSATFESFPFVLTTEGQYIVKNLVIIGAALVIGGTVREEGREPDPAAEAGELPGSSAGDATADSRAVGSDPSETDVPRGASPEEDEPGSVPPEGTESAADEPKH